MGLLQRRCAYLLTPRSAIRGVGKSLVAAAALALLAACSTGGDAGSNQFADLMSQANDYQKRIMQDGEVTFAEYEQAVLAAKQCVMDEVGSLVIVNGPTLAADEVHLVLGFSAADGDDPDQTDGEIDLAILGCLSEYVDYVELAYARTHQPSEAEIRQAVADLIRCLNQAGFDSLTVDSTMREVGETVTDAPADMNEAGGRCIAEHGLGMANLRQQ
jgi:hypothetical protein